MTILSVITLVLYLNIGSAIVFVFIHPSQEKERIRLWWQYVLTMLLWPILLIVVGTILVIDQKKWEKIQSATDWGFHIKDQNEIREEITNNGK